MTWFRSALFNTNTLRLNTENGGLSNGLNSRAGRSVILLYPPCRNHQRRRVWPKRRTRNSHESLDRNKRGAAFRDRRCCAGPLVFASAEAVLDTRSFHSTDAHRARWTGLSAPHAGIVSALLLADDGPERVRSDRAARHDGIDDAALSPALASRPCCHQSADGLGGLSGCGLAVSRAGL